MNLILEDNTFQFCASSGLDLGNVTAKTIQSHFVLDLHSGVKSLWELNSEMYHVVSNPCIHIPTPAIAIKKGTAPPVRAPTTPSVTYVPKNVCMVVRNATLLPGNNSRRVRSQKISDFASIRRKTWSTNSWQLFMMNRYATDLASPTSRADTDHEEGIIRIPDTNKNQKYTCP